MQAPVLVLNTNTDRDQGRSAQLGNIVAAKAVADVVRTTLGPRSMLKMILDPMGGIVMTNDGNAILREIDVNHPAAKSMIELSRTQDEEVGDGTTSVIILAGEMLQVSQQFIERNMHPRTIVSAYNLALIDAEEIMKSISIDLDLNNQESILNIIRSTIGTKFLSRYGNIICELALKSVALVKEENNNIIDIDIKRYIRVERIPGGTLDECKVLDGILLNKEVLHPKMRKKIINPKILCLDCPLEYTKGESQLKLEMKNEDEFEKYLNIETDYILEICEKIKLLKPDIVVTEKGCSELAQHYLMKAGISVLRRLKKTDNVRLAKACNAIIGHRIDLLQEKNLGTSCGLFEIRQIADETFAFFIECKNPKACSIILRGGPKEVLQEMERNLQDALAVTRNILINPKILPGGGATEMEISVQLNEKAKKIDSIISWPYRAVANAIEVIPRTLIQNCGGQVIRTLTSLRSKHADINDKNHNTWGINGITGEIVDMNTYGIWEPFIVKLQTIKTSIESASMLLRIDDVVSGLRNQEKD